MSYHGAASDIWSCGVILFALLTGRLPFDDENIRVLLQKVKNGRFNIPADLPADAKDLITRMLVVDPEKRITVRETITSLILDGGNNSSCVLPAATGH
jgi:serine/threonine protein kinase